jgi:hypothetical protein
MTISEKFVVRVWYTALTLAVIAACSVPPLQTPTKIVVSAPPTVTSVVSVPGQPDTKVVLATAANGAKLATPVAVLEEPAQTTKIIDRSCSYFRPIYLTEADLHALSAQTLTAIINNNNEGAARCGWKKTPGE